jgi:hypothetical protein
MLSYQEEIKLMTDVLNNAHCEFCGEPDLDELFMVIPIKKDKEPYIICHYCSALFFKEDRLQSINSSK